MVTSKGVKLFKVRFQCENNFKIASILVNYAQGRARVFYRHEQTIAIDDLNCK
jgi:hypothetical protein